MEMIPLSYIEQEKFYVALTCVILGFKDGSLYVLTSKYKLDKRKDSEGLISGFLRSSESLSQSVQRIVQTYIGAKNIYIDQIGTYDNLDTAKKKVSISVAYCVLIDMAEFDENNCKMNDIRWENSKTVGKFISNHNQILLDTIFILKERFATQPIAFNLLPLKFTLPQLQLLYETIYQVTLDKRNFRKKILEMDILEKQECKDKMSLKREAFYYTFVYNKYIQLLQRGYHFSL